MIPSYCLYCCVGAYYGVSHHSHERTTRVQGGPFLACTPSFPWKPGCVRGNSSTHYNGPAKATPRPQCKTYFYRVYRLGSPRETQVLILEPGQNFAAGINLSQVELGDKLTSLSGQCLTHWTLERESESVCH